MHASIPRILGISFLVLTICTEANSSVILLSQEHSIHGWGFAVNSPSGTQTYDSSGSQPVSATLDLRGTDPDGYPGTVISYSEAGDFFVSAWALEFSWAAGQSEAHAVNTYTFRSTTPQLLVSYTESSFGFSSIDYALYDLTSSTQVVSVLTPEEDMARGTGTAITADHEYTVDPSHVYQLNLYADSWSNEVNNPVSLSVRLDVIPDPVPEPATLCLLAGGIWGLVMTGRRRSKAK